MHIYVSHPLGASIIMYICGLNSNQHYNKKVECSSYNGESIKEDWSMFMFNYKGLFTLDMNQQSELRKAN